jgi:putative oxidoreductase
MGYGILFLRLVLGLTMAAHGAQKLFGWWDGPGLHGVRSWLASMRFRGGWLPVLALVTAEFAGGLSLALGLFTPFAAFAVIVVMFVAVATTHWRNGFWNGAGGYEFNLLIVAGAAAVAATGPGRFALDEAAGWADDLSGGGGGVGALAAAAAAALLLLAAGRRPEVPAAQPAEGTAPLRRAA